MWNLNKTEGWKKYKEIKTESNVLEAIALRNDKDPTAVINKFDIEITKAKISIIVIGLILMIRLKNQKKRKMRL